MEIINVKNSAEGGKVAAEILVKSICSKPRSVLGLATGSSPESTYDALVESYRRGGVTFEYVKTVNLDEYVGLPTTSEQSYHYFMWKKFFSRVNIKAENTHIPNGMAEKPEEECARYNELIESLGGIDIQLLGIGHNGHIGFNEPADTFAGGTHVVELAQSTIEANSRFFPSKNEVPTRAITMGTEQIMRAKRIILLAFGKGKAEILHRALRGEISPTCPASILQNHKNLTVIADTEALSKII
jgi:glucosamine-6-phosphate deaminase